MCFLIHTELDLWYALVNWSCERHISVNYLHVSILLFFYIYIFLYFHPEFVYVQMYVSELLSFVNCLNDLIGWLINRNLNESYIFLNEKHTCFSSTLEIAF